ncbi:MAG: hypothetical protein ABI163_17320 [Thermoanaerobaculia bacterium]
MRRRALPPAAPPWAPRWRTSAATRDWLRRTWRDNWGSPEWASATTNRGRRSQCTVKSARILSYLGLDLHDLQDALDQREGRPIRRRNLFEKQPILEEALLSETEALFQRWSRLVPTAQRPRLDRTESEVMDLLRGLVRDLDAPEEGP